ncbi:glycosyltransferase family 25 protein [Sphingomonas arenae]|uniref:glycosyltransferase family 25 protein n=1 Tax=Sphingomonas arenae TaxID=2812555 RepID=UPI001967AFD1|nr:glycosyltransferase family 25 protein [Sphingomonas arenae]
MKPALSAFEFIRIINLPQRTDRRQQMERELRRIGLARDPRVSFHAAVAPDSPEPFRRRGEKGVFLSHLAVLREAASKGASVLILEDDADFTAALPTGDPESVGGIFYGGHEAATPGDLLGSDIIGAHCMGFSADVAKALVPYLTALLDHSSPPPIDGAYVWFRRSFPDVPTTFAVPPIAVQRPSRSDIAPLRFFDRVPLLREAAGQARRIKRRVQRRAQDSPSGS